MNAHTSLIPLVEANPAMVLLEPVKFDQFFDEVAREVRSHVPDLKTEKGRKAVASLAFKVTKTKTAIDDARKALTEEKRAEIKKVDEAGKVIRDKLDALRDEARAPLTEWEKAEAARTEACQAIIGTIKRDGVILGDDTCETVAGRLDLIRAIEITADQFQELEEIAKTLRDNAIQSLEAGAERLRVAEEERAELARLRAADEERQAREAVAHAQDQRAQQMIDYIKQVGMGFIGGQTHPYPILLRELETKIVIDDSYGAREAEVRQLLADTLKSVQDAFDRHMAEASQRAEREAAEKAQEEAARAYTEKMEAKAREHEAALAAERRRTEEAEAARQAEIDRAARVEAQRLADLKAEEDAQAAREADRAHRGQVMGAAKEAIMEAAKVSERAAKDIVLAIAAGSVPAVSIRF